MCRRRAPPTCRSSISNIGRGAAPSPAASRIARTALLIGASGLRSSCASIARNSVLRRSASASRVSASRWRVTSRTILDAPTTLPSSSLIGEMVSETQMRRPSFLTRSVTKCSIRLPALRLAMISSSSAMRSGGMTSEM